MSRSINKVEELQEKVKMLEEKTAFLEKVLNEVPANIYVSDIGSKSVVWCNKTNEETLGFNLEEIRYMGKDYFNAIMHPDDLDISDDSVEHYEHFEGAGYGGIFRARHRDSQEYKWFIGWARVFETEKGKVKTIVCADVDMSPQMNTDVQLAEALKENLKLRHELLRKTLTRREAEVVQMVCDGYNSKTIADQLHVSIHTIDTHRKNLLRKLNVRNTVALVALASEMGF